MNKLKLNTLAILSGILLSLPWFSHFSGIILLVALIPLLALESHLYENKTQNRSKGIFKYAYLSFVIWNILTSYWIYNATLFGAVAAIILNALFVSLIFWLFHIIKRTTGPMVGYLSLIFMWTAFEFVYLNAEISWPWLNLGNGFAKDFRLIQWYEYTGTLGGTIWVLSVNILLFQLLKNFIQKKKVNRLLNAVTVLIVVLPVAFSLVRFYTYKETTKPENIVVLQPNIDPYHEKFSGMTNEEQLQILLDLARKNQDTTTDYMVGPETSIDNQIWENDIYNNENIIELKKFIKLHPRIKFVTGLTSFKLYQQDETPSSTARKFADAPMYYDVYNSAMQVDTGSLIQIYHKSKLVVGVEMMPYPKVFKYLNKLTIDLGGTTGSLGTQPRRGVFHSSSPNNKISIAPVICYESIYGEYLNDYIKEGANLIFVVTNDGWWGNTPGYKQHLSYSQIRAIETRRSVARSANTGISAFINQKGEITKETGWWERTVLKGKINANSKLTFYVKHGDYLGRISIFLTILIILYFLADKFNLKIPVLQKLKK